jgi:porin
MTLPSSNPAPQQVEKPMPVPMFVGTQKAGIRAGIVILLLLGVLLSGSAGHAQTVDVQVSLREDKQHRKPLLRFHPWRFLRGKANAATDFLKDETGLRVGVSDTITYQIDPFISTPHHTTVNTLDLLGAWQLVESRTFGEGVLGFLFRDRTNAGPLTGNTLSSDIGLPWGVNNSGSAGYARFNQLWWQQSLLNESLLIQLGKVDEKTHFNINRVASSDGRDFLMQSMVYSQTIAFPSEGLGFNVRYWPTKRWYLDFGAADANGNPQNKPSDSLNSFSKGQYFEAVELGGSPELRWLWSGLGESHYRLMGWHTAHTSSHDGGGGVSLSADQEIPYSLVPFVRIGYAPAKINRTWVEVDGGIVSVAPFGRDSDRVGVGITWARPSSASLQNQTAAEFFYRLEVVEGLQITPDIELVFKPAEHPTSNFEAVFGLRLRAFL